MAKDNDIEQQSVEMDGEAPPKKNRSKLVAIGAVLGVMALEAVIIFVLVKTFVVPKPSAAEASMSGSLDPQAGQKAPEPVEIEVVKFRAQNDRSQRVQVYDMTIFVIVQSDKQEEFTGLLDKRRETIRDRFTRIVRASDPARFQESDLATLRAQFKNEMNQVLGKPDLVQEVLIPTIFSFGE